MTRARAEGIPWLSLVVKRDAELIVKHFAEGKIRYDSYKKFITMPDGKTLMTLDEWTSRVKSLSDWFTKTGTAWISNGPYMLTYYSPEEQKLMLEAFRDPTYPFGPISYGEATPVSIKDIKAPLIPVGGSTEIIIDAKGVGEIFIKYVIRDAVTKTVIASGSAEKTLAGFVIKLPKTVTEQLLPYAVYELLLIAYSSEVTLTTETVVKIQTVPDVSKSVAELEDMLRAVKGDVAELKVMLKTLSEVAVELKEALKAARGDVAELKDVIEAINDELLKRIDDVNRSLSDELAKSVALLSETLSSAIEGLGKATEDSIKALGAETSKSLENLRTVTEDRISSVERKLSTGIEAVEDRIDSVERKLSRDIETIGKTADSAQFRAGVAMVVSIINLIILLAIAGILFMRRS
ncbi:MAG: hypothetical protein P3X22_007905 [Thermoprotei archaeon]|nr:hypothetical protein [Thermoprotei archaeon]